MNKIVADEIMDAPLSFTGGQSLQLRGVGKAYGARQVLQDLDLTVPAGQFIAVIGRSGCGKTTLLRLLAGLERPSAGSIAIGGVQDPETRQDVRLLFQDPRLLPWQRVEGNVGLTRAPEWRADAMAALTDVGLADRAKDWPAALSGGQKQRVALARALVARPRVLLLDEPFGALDALTRRDMHQLLSGLYRTHHFTTLLITHDVAEALALAERVLVLRDGKVALDLLVDRTSESVETLSRRLLAEV